MTGRVIVCIAPTEWEGAWQRYHEMMRRLAGAGNTVLVVDNLYRVFPGLPGSLRGAARLLRKGWQAISQMRLIPRRVERGIALLTPPALPGGLAMLSWPLLRIALRRATRSLGMDAPVLWCAFPAPGLDRIIQELAPALIVYDCAAAFSDDPRTPRAVVEAESRLLHAAHLVFTDSRNLWERHRRVHQRCYWIPTGVDFARFASVRPGQRRWSEPVVGYIGTLHAWLDVGLIVAVAKLRRQWRFVFVGPRRERAALGALEALPNVELVGPQPHDAIPSFVAQFDAAWIPYKVTEFTRYVFPTKLLEYLAAGKPVVATDLSELGSFVPPVRIAAGAEGMAGALEEAMRAGDDARGRDLAMTYDWSVQMATVHRHLDTALAARS